MMGIREDFEKNGFLSEVDVLTSAQTEYYAEKCNAFIDVECRKSYQ